VAVSASQPTATLPPVRDDRAKLAQLTVTKRRATGLLIATTAVFLLTLLGDGERGWLGFVRATAEASMVGGLADWFAVTALFRHPLGIPIPHTAIIPERKDQFGRTLGEFVQDNFLSPDAIVDRIRSGRVVGRAAEWLSHPDNATTIARHAADIVVGVTDTLRDEDVHALIEETVITRVEAVPLAPLAGRALEMMTAQDRHHELLDSLVRGLDRTLAENRENLRARFGRESPWWVPEPIDGRIFEKLYDGVRKLLQEIAVDPRHELRMEFDKRVRALAVELGSSPALLARGEELKRELLAHQELRQWSSALWRDLKSNLRKQAADPDSELRRRLADMVQAAAVRLRDDPGIQAKAEELAAAGVRYVSEHFHDEIASLVSATVSRWDANETSRKLELLLGPDLQFIRINGTVVGGLAGLALHSIVVLVG
jgi:uncharacterized membrane-anchored protein YjiN (DUF445 family)